MPLPITALYAGLNALLLILLSFRVIRVRQKARVAFGDAGDPELIHAMRGHANAAETIPIALILLALVEGMGAPALAVHALGLCLTAGRVLHAYYFADRSRALRLRQIGMGLTFLAIGAAALGLIGHGALTLAGGGA